MQPTPPLTTVLVRITVRSTNVAQALAVVAAKVLPLQPLLRNRCGRFCHSVRIGVGRFVTTSRIAARTGVARVPLQPPRLKKMPCGCAGAVVIAAIRITE